MNKENILRNAEKNTDRMQNIKSNMMMVASRIINQPCNKGWKYVSDDNAFYLYDLSCIGYPNINQKVSVELNGLEVVLAKEPFDDTMTMFARIKADRQCGSPVDELLRYLKMRRMDFENRLMDKICPDVIDYINRHEKELCSLYTGDDNSICTEPVMIWTCGDESEAGAISSEAAVEMQKILDSRFNYMGSEDLSDFENFYPTVFADKHTLEKEFLVKEGITLVISRKMPDTQDMYTPALYASLVIARNSKISVAIDMALEAKYWHARSTQYSDFEDFARRLAEYTEWELKDGKAVAYIPVYNNIRFVKRMAERVYEGMYSFRTCIVAAPSIFNIIDDCIEVTLL